MRRQWVLLRGLAREQGHWREFSQMLQEQDADSEVIGIDLPGAGEYFRVSSPFSIEGIAEFVHSHFKKGPRPEQRILFGISLGGMVAVELSRLYPANIDGLVIANSSFKNVSPVLQRLQFEAYPKLYRAISASNSEEREAAVLDMVSNAKNKDTLVREWATIANERPISALNFAKQLFAASQYELPEKKTVEKVLVLTSHADHMVDHRCSQALAEKWQVPMETHNSAGHEICLDEPQWTIDQMKKHYGK
jgi:pimeloyl-ACP methyl ester carboxylesterase